jgi:hypothetical protein
MGAADTRFLIIVAPREHSLHAQLQQLFEDNDRVEVVFDRRDPSSGARHHDERRALEVEASLRTFGWAIVARPGAGLSKPPEGQTVTAGEFIRAL